MALTLGLMSCITGNYFDAEHEHSTPGKKWAFFIFCPKHWFGYGAEKRLAFTTPLGAYKKSPTSAVKNTDSAKSGHMGELLRNLKTDTINATNTVWCVSFCSNRKATF